MATIEPVPELADGGFWYVCAQETVESPLGSGRMVTRPAGIAASSIGWTAAYIGDGTVVVRSPVPLVGMTALNESSARKLTNIGETKRPHGRIRGR